MKPRRDGATLGRLCQDWGNHCIQRGLRSIVPFFSFSSLLVGVEPISLLRFQMKSGYLTFTFFEFFLMHSGILAVDIRFF